MHKAKQRQAITFEPEEQIDLQEAIRDFQNAMQTESEAMQSLNDLLNTLKVVTIPQYPPFCWTELIVNAVAHRDYSILGTDIMVKIFDHHYVVESPGVLPGMVRIDNIRQMHFSRNPKIAEFMREYKLVKEFGEGVDRMFREMAEAGNPALNINKWSLW